jgi:hypothetical protein
MFAEGLFGPQMQGYEQHAKVGNAAVGKVTREPLRYHWELGFTTSGQTRSVFEAWCAEQ